MVWAVDVDRHITSWWSNGRNLCFNALVWLSVKWSEVKVCYCTNFVSFHFITLHSDKLRYQIKQTYTSTFLSIVPTKTWNLAWNLDQLTNELTIIITLPKFLDWFNYLEYIQAQNWICTWNGCSLTLHIWHGPFMLCLNLAH